MLVTAAVFDSSGILIGVEFKAEFAEETHNWHYEFLACYKTMRIILSDTLKLASVDWSVGLFVFQLVGPSVQKRKTCIS